MHANGTTTPAVNGTGAPRGHRSSRRRTVEEIQQSAALLKARADEQEQKNRAAVLRAQGKQLKVLNRGFDAETRGRLRGRATPVGGSADSKRERWALRRLTEDARDLARNNPIMRVAIGGAQDVIVGRGPSFQVQTADAAFNRQAEALFAAWFDEGIDRAGLKSGAEMLATGVGEWFVAGREGLLLTRDGDIQEIEAERLVNPSGKINDETFCNGVERDGTGRIIAYHIADWSTSGTTLDLTHTRRIPAEHFLYLPRPTMPEPNLTAPEPGMQAIIELIELIGETNESAVIAYRVAAMLSVIVTTEYPGDLQAAMLGETVARSDGGSDLEMELRNGMVNFFGQGSSATQVKGEHPSSQFQDFVWLLIQLICAEIRLPPEILFYRFISNFSASRGAMAIAKVAIDRYRAPLTRCCRRLWRWRLARAINSGEIMVDQVPAGWDLPDVIWPPLPQLDRKHEIEATRLEIEGLLKAPSTAIRELYGAEFEQVTSQISKDRERQQQLGLFEVALPGSTSGPVQGSQPDEASDA